MQTRPLVVRFQIQQRLHGKGRLPANLVEQRKRFTADEARDVFLRVGRVADDEHLAGAGSRVGLGNFALIVKPSYATIDADPPAALM